MSTSQNPQLGGGGSVFSTQSRGLRLLPLSPSPSSLLGSSSQGEAPLVHGERDPPSLLPPEPYCPACKPLLRTAGKGSPRKRKERKEGTNPTEGCRPVPAQSPSEPWCLLPTLRWSPNELELGDSVQGQAICISAS